jgi:hypothetical protein
MYWCAEAIQAIGKHDDAAHPALVHEAGGAFRDVFVNGRQPTCASRTNIAPGHNLG